MLPVYLLYWCPCLDEGPWECEIKILVFGIVANLFLWGTYYRKIMLKIAIDLI